MKDEPTKEADFGGASSLTYTVLMGGDTVSKTEVGTITYNYTPDEFTVTYMVGDTQYEQTKTVSRVPQLPATTPTKDADEKYTYAFEGWYTDAELTTAFDNTQAIPADKTVYAKFTATPIAGGEDDILYGDCYVDGTVNGADAVLLAQYLAKMEVDIDLVAADVYYDDTVNGADAVLLAQYLAKMEVTLGPVQ